MGFLTQQILGTYRTKVLVETGTFEGDSIRAALAAGIPEIHSVELNRNLYDANKLRFAEYPNVTLHHGNSPVQLREIVKTLQSQAMFWLDAHYCGGDTGFVEKSATPRCPILDEIAAIAESPIKNHVILVDDIRFFGKPEFDNISLVDVTKAIYRINPAYRFGYEADREGVEPDILVAAVYPIYRGMT